MSEPAIESADRKPRFPGFDVLAQAGQWDGVTAAAVVGRLGRQPDARFFSPTEQAIAGALFAQLLDQRSYPGEPSEHAVPVLQMVDARLAEGQTDGWHYESMPADPQAWRDSLAHLDADASGQFGTGFARCLWHDQAELLGRIQSLGSRKWHGEAASHVWGLWTRYACTAFYSHPQAWNEIGFPGPAYPRGYKNIGIARREPFEVPDARPGADPLRASSSRDSRWAGDSGEFGT